MLFSKLNPFLRYGSTFLMSPHKSNVVSCDCHLHYVHSGGFTSFVENKAYYVPEKSIYYCPKGTVYHFELDKNQLNNTILTSLNFDLGQSECNNYQPRRPIKYTENMSIKYDPLFNTFKNEEYFLGNVKVFNSAEKYLPYFSRIMKEFQLQSQYSSDLCSCILKELLVVLHSIPETLPAQEEYLLKEVVYYIDENFKEQLDNKKIADIFGYHPNYLGKLFKQYMSISIHQYILSLRISEAKKLICSSRLAFSKISEETGFIDYAYFSAYFKKKTGMSPSEYRQYHKNVI